MGVSNFLITLPWLAQYNQCLYATDLREELGKIDLPRHILNFSSFVKTEYIRYMEVFHLEAPFSDSLETKAGFLEGEQLSGSGLLVWFRCPDPAVNFAQRLFQHRAIPKVRPPATACHHRI